MIRIIFELWISLVINDLQISLFVFSGILVLTQNVISNQSYGILLSYDKWTKFISLHIVGTNHTEYSWRLQHGNIHKNILHKKNIGVSWKFVKIHSFFYWQ